MIKEGAIAQVLRIHKNMYGSPITSEYVYGRIASIDELSEPPFLVEVTLPSKLQESPCFYRFWAEEENIKNVINPTVAEDTVNPFGY